ncbi:mitochondrial amidoxime reducing component 2-like isoform X2 [Babylonia areolata]|uniref:mitochondrial amidoxime reducing component 2-like isoform X2 n=1 Tax=Babylonia areolata TaxID=304850 RepID=UPI003FD308C9
MFSSFPLDFLLSKEGAVFTALVATSALKYVSLQRVRAARDQEFTLVGHVSELTVYPIKACGGVDLQSAQATDVGLCADGYYDRRWMIQSKDTGSYVNMRMHPRLTLVTTTVDSDWFVVSAPDMTPLHLPRYPNPAEFEHVNVNIYGQTLRALDVGSEASDWFTRFLRQPVRLLHAGPGVGTRDAYYMPLSWETEARKGDKNSTVAWTILLSSETFVLTLWWTAPFLLMRTVGRRYALGQLPSSTTFNHAEDVSLQRWTQILLRSMRRASLWQRLESIAKDPNMDMLHCLEHTFH